MWFKLAENIFVWTGTATQYKLTSLRKFFAIFGVDPSELVFFLRDKNEPVKTDTMPERYEIRKKYWSFALPYIQEKFGTEGPFSKANPTTGNWINGYFGVNNFAISLTANFDCARVRLYFGSVKEANKEAFDFIFAHKSDIEDALGVSLVWNRADDNIASYVAYEIHGISIGNEADWIRMAKFHAEWSRKFADVMLPVLQKKYPSVVLPE